MSKLHLACVVGARPNFMKMAPILRSLAAYPWVKTTLIHTGQHYDDNLSEVFFRELQMKRPEVSLEVGSGKHGQQTARILERFEGVIEDYAQRGDPFDRVVVVGDVNSTLACALAAVKLGVPVAHVEAGLRSFDRSMPEEINRLMTDSVSDCLLVSEPSGMDNLRREGHPEDRLHLVGNVMIDSLLEHLPRARELDTLRQYGLQPRGYGVVTLHRPANVDSAEILGPIVDALVAVSREIKLVFPVHPRTDARLERFGLLASLDQAEGITRLPPLGYLPFLAITSQAQLIITDSGGLQEESTALAVPCITMRPNTERPITVSEGTSTLVGNDAKSLMKAASRALTNSTSQGSCPPLWDGLAAGRISAVLAVHSIESPCHNV